MPASHYSSVIKMCPRQRNLAELSPISYAWAGCPWAPLRSARKMGLPVLMSSSFPSLPEPALLTPRELPSLSAAMALLGHWDQCSRASPMLLSPGPVPASSGQGSTILGTSPSGCRPTPPVPSHGLPSATPSASTLLDRPCSLNCIPDVLGYQYKTTAGMPLTLRDWGPPGTIGGEVQCSEIS